MKELSVKDSLGIDLTGKSSNMMDLNRVGLTTLKGSPDVVNGAFYIETNELTTLEYGPSKVNGHYMCSGNSLTNLKFLARDIKGTIDCSNNKITSLEGCPKIVNDNFKAFNNKLVNLKGGPEEVKGTFTVSSNDTLVSLEGGPKKVDGRFATLGCPKLKNVIEQIVKYDIKAESYVTDEGTFSYEDLSKKFEDAQLSKTVKRKGFRTLLGLKDEI